MAKTIRQRLVSFLEKRSGSPEKPSTSLSAAARWINAGNQTVSGENISHEIALQIGTVRTCITVLHESVASLPCMLYEKTDKGRIEVDNDLSYLLNVEPNEEMSAFDFWSTIVGANALTGNSYAEIVRDQDLKVAELYPLNPLVTEPFRLPTGKLVYRTRQGKSDGTWRFIDAKNILHFRLFALDGINGISPITAHRQSLGLTRAAEKFGAKLFGNGSKPGGVLSGPEDLSPEQLTDAQESWEATQGGSNQGRTAVLPGGWVYTQIGLSPEDSQFLETRQFQRTEVCAMFRVPAHMAGDTSKISNSSYEQMNLSFLNDVLRPILTRIELELNRKLLPQVGRKANKYFVRFDLTERLRADHATQMEGVALGRQWSLLSVDEGRIALGLNPIGDDSRLAPINMFNASLVPEQDVIPGSQPAGDALAAGTDNRNKQKSKKPKTDSLSKDTEEAEEPDIDMSK